MATEQGIGIGVWIFGPIACLAVGHGIGVAQGNALGNNFPLAAFQFDRHAILATLKRPRGQSWQMRTRSLRRSESTTTSEV